MRVSALHTRLPSAGLAAAGSPRQQGACARSPPSPRQNASPLAGRRPSFRARHLVPNAGLGSDEPDDSFISSEEDFAAHVASADVVVADFMARWCRKCIYIKPKLVTLMASKFPGVPLAFIDVNAVPSTVVSGSGVTKMPTIVIFVKGEIAGTYVAGESAPTAVLAVEALVEKAVKAAKK